MAHETRLDRLDPMATPATHRIESDLDETRAETPYAAAAGRSTEQTRGRADGRMGELAIGAA